MTSRLGNLGLMYRRDLDPRKLGEDARRAEALGFDEFWIVEDCFYLGGIAQAAIALAATSSIRVGIGINPGVAHNPAILAMEYATLARAFPGRLVGGIGHGVAEWMTQIGAEVDSPLTAIEEITTSMRRILRGERVSLEGRYVQLRDVQLDTPPQVAPPIVLGVRGPKSIRLAGTCADGVLLAENSSPQYVRDSRALLDAARTSPAYLGVYANALVSNRDPSGAIERMRRVTARQNQGGLSAATSGLSYASDLKALAEEGGLESLYGRMPEEWVRDLTITGTVDEGRIAIEALYDAGADSVILCAGPEDWATWFESVEPLALG